MNDFEIYPELETSIIPDFNNFIDNRLNSIKSKPNIFDPYKMMLNKKSLDSGKMVDITSKNNWPEKDIKALEDFCRKYGIIGFNCGRMHPIAALAMLKRNLGIGDDLGENTPIGYEKPSKFEPNYPYLNAVNQKSLLKG